MAEAVYNHAGGLHQVDMMAAPDSMALPADALVLRQEDRPDASMMV
jgi:hypothetical protein